ncbi:UNVERIFIED_CONTAM: hypothetical protein GTU68_027869 [Idotea baltica]|nr:hypothetical protein [Idotea baltica]
MPASNTRALEKGPILNADAIVIDLEDSVAPDAKPQARLNALAALGQDYGHKLRVLRVNDIHSTFFADDMSLLKQVQPDAVLLPKVESAQTIVDVSQMLDGLGGSVKLWAMLETTKAVVNANSIAQSRKLCPQFNTVCIGNNDLAREAGMQVSSDRSLLVPWLMNLLLAAKAFELNILDGVYNDFKDVDGFTAECDQGAAMGMSGKTLIHPNQIDIANRAYAPSDADINRAQKIVDAFAQPENAQLGVLQIDGRMVERLHLDMALQTIEIAERIKAFS